MHHLLLFVISFALSSSAQGEVTCGCPYKPKNRPAYDPSKLFIMDGSDKTCTLTCENGYVLENYANYVECTNGQKWLGQKREMFGIGKLVDNPFLTCVKVTAPKTCPPGTWKTFACKNCDPSKIMVPPSTKGECTIMCDKGYRLVSNQGGSANVLLAEATLKSSSWTMRVLPFSVRSELSPAATAAAVSFNCELLPGTKPKPPACGCGYDFLEGDEYDQSQLTASGTECGTCRIECQNGYAVVSDAVTGPIPYATCTQYRWSAPGKGELSAIEPKFSCTKDTTSPTDDACQKCAKNLIKITTSGDGGRAMARDTIDTSGSCAVRTFVCEGPSPVLEMNGSDLGTVTDKRRVTFSVNCNADGTAWTACGNNITQMECSSTL